MLGEIEISIGRGENVRFIGETEGSWLGDDALEGGLVPTIRLNVGTVDLTFVAPFYQW